MLRMARKHSGVKANPWCLVLRVLKELQVSCSATPNSVSWTSTVLTSMAWCDNLFSSLAAWPSNSSATEVAKAHKGKTRRMAALARVKNNIISEQVSHLAKGPPLRKGNPFSTMLKSWKNGSAAKNICCSSEDSSSVSRAHSRRLTNVCSSSSRGPNALYRHRHSHTHISAHRDT